MSLQQHFRSYITREKLFTPDQPLILAVSGGVDSVVLTALCHEAGFNFSIAHCNFQLRGEESERDRQFVRELAAHYQVELHLRVFDTQAYVASKHVSTQVAAREMRYQWFNDLVIQSSPGCRLLTAHHLDDSVETSLMNFFKGTGIAGLRGILPLNGYIVRPLLFASKQDLTDYADGNGLSHVKDSTNEENKYTRNFFRNQLIPLVKTVFPEAEQNLFDNQARFRDIETLYRQAVGVYTKKLMVQRGGEWFIPLFRLLKVNPLNTILYELVKDFGFSPAQVPGILALADALSGKYVQSASHRIIRNRNWLIIAPVETSEPGMILVEGPGTFPTGGFQLTIGPASPDVALLNNDPSTALVNESLIKYPLILRRASTGDYFYPLGMKKKKKLARFFIDIKLSKTDKEKVWVIECQKKIVWVAGLRLDDRFRVIDEQKQMLLLHWGVE